MCICICTRTCIYIYMYIYIYAHDTRSKCHSYHTIPSMCHIEHALLVVGVRFSILCANRSNLVLVVG